MFKRFKPMDDTSKLEMSQALMMIKMGPKESPSTLFTQICTLQNRYGVYDTDEQQILACIANALPREYKAILAIIWNASKEEVRTRVIREPGTVLPW
jgi:hypothetical protein